jgi:hypothetical protein
MTLAYYLLMNSAPQNGWKQQRSLFSFFSRRLENDTEDGGDGGHTSQSEKVPTESSQAQIGSLRIFFFSNHC